ncbi:hypothetical protein [Streptomyces nitrosporeus]|uniref:hypothetical protein n=1 Tax=Streptomyces nitrosporeus TaxID=28894 RepID=UPI0039A12875
MTSHKDTRRPQDETALDEVTEEAGRAARRPVPEKDPEEDGDGGRPGEGDALSPSPPAQQETAGHEE